MKKALVAIFLFLVVPGQLFAASLRVASTTSTENTGLFNYLLPIFEKKTGITVQVIAVGTGAAIELGKRGDVDAVFVHAKELELRALSGGFFVERREVMYNDFVLVGPPRDPARIAGSKTAPEALKKLAASGQRFIGRGDNSGTHVKEKELWAKAAIEPAKSRMFYMESGQGMAKTLRIANEKNAYALTDRGTFLFMKDELDLKILFEKDPLLFNQYGVMAVNPARHPHVKIKEARVFIDWLTSKEGRRAIAAFKDKNGNRLFYPSSSHFLRVARSSSVNGTETVSASPVACCITRHISVFTKPYESVKA